MDQTPTQAPEQTPYMHSYYCDEHKRFVCAFCGNCPASLTCPPGFSWKYTGKGARELHKSDCRVLKTVDWTRVVRVLVAAGLAKNDDMLAYKHLKAENVTKAQRMVREVTLHTMMLKMASSDGLKTTKVYEKDLAKWKTSRKAKDQHLAEGMLEYEWARKLSLGA